MNVNINNWEVVEFEDSKLYLKEDHEILIVDNESNHEIINQNDKIDIKNNNSKMENKNENEIFDYNFYNNLYKQYLEYSFILLKPFEVFYKELNKKELDKYIV